MEKIVNEKVSFKDIIIGAAIFFGTSFIMTKYEEYKFIKNLYELVNFDDLSEDEKEKIELIRKEVLNKIEKSNIFNDFPNLKKEYILDSIQNATIRISNKPILVEKKYGFFIHLPDIKNRLKFIDYLTSDIKPSKENIIVVDRDLIKDEYFIDVLVHEIHHYIDLLYDIENRNYSNKINYHYYLDKNVLYSKYSEKIIKDKLYDLFDYDIANIFIEEGMALYYSKSISDNIKYLTSNKELFARINTLIYNMDRNNTNDFKSYFMKRIEKKEDIEDDLLLVLLLDLDKIDDLLNIHK